MAAQISVKFFKSLVGCFVSAPHMQDLVSTQKFGQILLAESTFLFLEISTVLASESGGLEHSPLVLKARKIIG